MRSYDEKIMGDYECSECGNDEYDVDKEVTYHAAVRMKTCTDCGNSVISQVYH